MFKFLVTLVLSVFLMGTLYAEEATKESVTKLYIATFDRAPDNAGLDYWVYNSNLSQEEIAMSFFEQQETKDKYPIGTSNEEFINSTYTNLFKRTPDDAGMSYWNDELNSGSIAKPIFIQAVVNGALADDATLLKNKTDVGLLFASSGNNDVGLAKEILSKITTNNESVSNALKSIEVTKDKDRQTFINRYISKQAQIRKYIIDDDYEYALQTIEESEKEFNHYLNIVNIASATNALELTSTSFEMIKSFVIGKLNLKKSDEKLANLMTTLVIDILILRKANNDNITAVMENVIKSLISNGTVFLEYKFSKDNFQKNAEYFELMVDFLIYSYDTATGVKNPVGFIVTQSRMLAKLGVMGTKLYFIEDVINKKDNYIVEFDYLMLYYSKSKTETNAGVIDTMNSSKNYRGSISKNATYEKILQHIYKGKTGDEENIENSRINIIKDNIEKFQYIVELTYRNNLKFKKLLSEKEELEAKQIEVPSKPTLISPSEESSIDNTNIKFQWESGTNADSYKFILFNSTDQLTKNDRDEVFATSVTFSSLESGKSFIWQVKACNDNGCSDWSERKFQTKLKEAPKVGIPSKPTLSYPSNKITVDKSIELKWGKVENADRYELFVSNFTDKVSIYQDTIYTNSQKIEHLSSEKTFVWQVKACNDSGCSDVSARVFYTNKKEVAVQQPTQQPTVPAGSKILSGYILDYNTNTAISNVGVRLNFMSPNNGARNFYVETNANGYYEVSMNEDMFSEYSKNDSLMLVASKNGYMSSTMGINIKQSNLFKINFKLAKTPNNVVVIDSYLHHLGDDGYKDAINSKFQTSTEGFYFSRSFNITQSQASCSSAVVTFDARGIQYGAKLHINDKYWNLNEGLSNGGSQKYSVRINNSTYHTGENHIGMESTKDKDYDDFEFTNLQISFCQ